MLIDVLSTLPTLYLKLNFCPQKHSPNIHNTISVDQPELAIKDENYPSVKNEDHIYFDIPLLSSVKEEVTLHHDDSDHIFPIDK